MSALNECAGASSTSQSCDVSGLVSPSDWVYLSCYGDDTSENTNADNTNMSYTLDFVAPSNVGVVNDGAGADVDSVGSATQLSANWSAATDTGCGVYRYWYAIGTTPGATDTVDWVEKADGGTSYTKTGLTLTDGVTYYFSVKTIDQAGNFSGALSSDGQTVDVSPPVQSAWNPAKGSIVATSTPTITLTTDEIATCKWSLLDSPYGSMPAGNVCSGGGTTSHSCSVSGMVEGADYVYISCADQHGTGDTSATNDNINYIIDETLPIQSGWSPASGSTLTTSSSTVTFTVNENSDCKWATSDLAYASMTGDCAGDGTTSISCDFGGLVEGANILSLACNDAAGSSDDSTSNTDMAYTLDTTPPTQSAWSPATSTVLNTTSQIITFTTNENADCKWSNSDLAYASMTGDCTGDGTTSQSCTVSGYPDNFATVYISCRDSYLNKDTSGTNTALTYTVHYTPPAQSAWNPSSSSCFATSTVSLTFSTDKNATCRWDLTDLGYSAMPAGNTCSGGGSTSQSCDTSGLLEPSDYVYLSCLGDDTSFNTSSNNTGIMYKIDMTGPSTVGVVNDGATTDVDLVASTSQLSANWNTATDSNCGLYRYWYAIGTTPGATDTVAWTEKTTGGTSVTVSSLTLTEGQTYYYSVKAVDVVGNFSASLVSDGQTVDVSPPVQSAWNPAKSSEVATTSQVITFTTDENATCRWSLTDQPYSSMPGANTCSGAGTTSQSCSTSVLVEGAEFVYISCADAVGNSDTAGTNDDIDYMVDATWPTQSGWSPASGTVLLTTSQSISFSMNENSDCKWALSDLAYASMTGDCTGDGTTSISCSVTGLSEGANVVSLACRDTALNQDNTSQNTEISYTVDTTPPVQSGWSPATSTTIVNATTTITFNTNEVGDCKWTMSGDLGYLSMPNDCTGDGTTSQTCVIAGLTDGTRTIYIACADSYGNEDTSGTNTALTYTVDTQPPVQSGWSPANSSCVPTATPTVTFATSKNATCRWDLTDYGYSAMPGGNACAGSGTTSQSCGVSGLLEPSDTLYLSCLGDDTTENTAANNYSLTYSVDMTPPSTVGVVNDGTAADVDYITSSTQLSANWSAATDAGCGFSKYWYSIGTSSGASDTVAWTEKSPTNTSLTVSSLSLAEGSTYYVSVKALDLAGNFSSIVTSDGQTLDTSPPVQSNWNPAKGSVATSSTPVITFNTDEPASCRWHVFDYSYAVMSANPCSGSGTTSHSCNVTTTLTEGLDYVYISCADNQGNQDTAGTNENVDLIIDNAWPTQSGWIPSNGATINTISKNILFSMNENADCKWSYNDEAYSAMPGDCAGDNTTSITCSVTSLPQGSVSVHLACRDIADNQDDSTTNKDLTYTVDYGPPSQYNWSPATGTVITSSSKDITLNTDEVGDCKWALSDLDYLSMTGDCTGDNTTSHTCSTTGLTDGPVTISISCRDAYNNKDTNSTNDDLTYTVDTLPPVQSGWAPATGTLFATSSQTIAFTTDEVADCRWSLSDQSYDSMVGDCSGDGTTSQSCDVTGMPDGAVTVSISCRDANGVSDTSGTNDDLSYDVDTTPPVQSGWSPATGTVIVSSSQAVTFTTDEIADCRWSLTDQSYASMIGDCTGDGTTSQSCNVTGYSEGAFTVSISCNDANANSDSSGTNTELSYTYDSLPPVQSGWSPATGTVITTDPRTITFTTDESADCRWSLTDQSYASMVGDCTGDGTTSQSCAATGYSDGAVTVSISCNDSYANSDSAGTNTDLSYTVDTTPPTQSGWSPATGTVITAATQTITFTTGEVADCRWSLTDQAYDSMIGDCTGDGTTSQSCDASGYSDGAITVSIACRDSNGAFDSAASNIDLTYTYDSTPPVQIGWSPATGSVFIAATGTIAFTTDETGDCRWSLTDQSYASMAGDCTGDGTTSQSCDVSGMTEGANTISISCNDSYGNGDTAVTNDDLPYTMDTTAPTQSGLSPASGTLIASTTQAFTFALNETGDCKWALADQAYGLMAGDCTGDGTTSMSCSATGLSEGANSVFFACGDSYGNLDTAVTNTETVVTVDTVLPVQSGWSPASGTFLVNSSQLVTFNTDESADCRWSLSDQSYAAMAGDCTGDGTTSQSCTVTGLTEGSIPVSFSCRDTAGNEDSSITNTEITYTVDAVPPVQSGWNPVTGTVFLSATQTITLTTNENADCRWSLADEDYATMVGDCTGDGTTSQSCGVSGLSEGANTISISCNDAAGNYDTAATNDDLAYVLDTTPPVLSGWSPASGTVVTSATQSITFTAGEAADCRWSSSDQDYASMIGDCAGDGTTSISCAASLSEGANILYFACNDSYGNSDTALTNSALSLSLDSTLPAQSGWSPASGTLVTSSAISVTLSTDESAYCRWALSDLGYAAMTIDCAGGGSASHDCSVTGMTDGSVVVSISCADEAGNMDTAGTNTEISYSVDTSVPVQSGWSPATGTVFVSASQTITFTTNESADCRWALSDLSYVSMANDCSGAGTTSQSCDVTAMPEGSVTVSIACADSGVGLSDDQFSNSDLSYLVDTLAPIQSAWSPSDGAILTSTSVSVAFDTDENASCRWSASDAAYAAMTSDCSGSGTVNQDCSISGLSQGTSTFYFACSDSYGNDDGAGDADALSYFVDSILPTISGISPATGTIVPGTTVNVAFNTDESATCAWSLSDDDYSAMTNSCGGTPASAHSCAVIGMTPGAMNSIFIACSDVAGNAHVSADNSSVSYMAANLKTTITLYSGWNLAGVSGSSGSFNPLTVFTGNDYEIYEYTNGDYQLLTGESLISPSAGKGYWIFVGQDAGEIQIGDSTVSLPSYDIQLTDGWNVISNPYDEMLEWADSHAVMTCGASPLTLPNIYSYGSDGAYMSITPGSGIMLMPWDGYMVKSGGSCKITITK